MYQQQNYSYYPQNQYMQQPRQTTGLKGRPVSSIEEARAASIDFDGSIFYFPDIANNRIYTKQINMDGTATLNMYELKEIPVENTMSLNNAAFITRDEFEQALNQLRADLQPPKIQF
jgi:hypothetical protein